MEFFAAIKQQASAQGKTLGAVSEAAGHARTYISTYTAKGHTPSITVASELAAPLGYGLALVPLDADPDALGALGAIPIDAAPREPRPAA